jgi:hypothetical protein
VSIALSDFVDTFVEPLLSGSLVRVQGPISLRERDRMMTQAGILGQSNLMDARLRRAERLLSVPALDDVDVTELSLWIGLHNILAFDHPDVDRVWARESTWQRAVAETVRLLALPASEDLRSELARFAAIDAWLALRRDDYTVMVGSEPLKYLGQMPGRSRVGWSNGAASEVQVETVLWIAAPHHATAEQLIPAALATSSVASLLYPWLASRSWSPVEDDAPYATRPLIRGICYAWARRAEWVEIGADLFERALLGVGIATFQNETALEAPKRGDANPKPSLAMRAAPGRMALGRGDEASHWRAFMNLSCALVHLHLLKVYEFDARVGLGPGVRRQATLAFLGLPLALAKVEDSVGSPLEGSGELGLSKRWQEYLNHLSDLVPRKSVEALTQIFIRAKKLGVSHE